MTPGCPNYSHMEGAQAQSCMWREMQAAPNDFCLPNSMRKEHVQNKPKMKQANNHAEEKYAFPCKAGRGGGGG